MSTNDTEIENLLRLYPLQEVKPYGNEIRAWEGPIGEHSLRLADYGHWCSISLAFGEVRHSHHTPMGEHGLVSATLSLSDTSRATALVNFDLPAPKWRVSAVAPKGRTSCVGPEGFRDGYIVTDDIVAHLLTFEDCCAQALTHVKDLFCGSWDSARSGWH